MVSFVTNGKMEEKKDVCMCVSVCVLWGVLFVQSDCERTAVAEDVLYTVINSRPNVIYGPHHGCFVGHFGATSLKLCKQQSDITVG